MLPYHAPALVKDLSRLDGVRSRLDAKGPLIRSWVGRLRRELEAEAIAASTSMEGVQVTADDVRRLLAHDPPRAVSGEDSRLVIGYRDAMEFVLRRADDPAFAWNVELIIGIHDRLMSGRFDLGAGRLRRVDRYVVNTATGDEVFRPPVWQDVPGLLDAALARLRDAPAHPALDSAWLHLALAAIHPFEDGNGRTARVLASLGMYRGGFKKKEFTSLEEWWGRHLSEYYRAFQVLGREFDPNVDVTEFIRAHVRAQLEQVDELDRRERLERRIWVAAEDVCRERGLPERMANAVWDAFYGREIGAGYYRELADVSPATATNDLSALVAAGLLEAVGSHRGRRYRPGAEVVVAVADKLGVKLEAGRELSAQVLNELARSMSERDLATGAAPLAGHFLPSRTGRVPGIGRLESHSAETPRRRGARR